MPKPVLSDSLFNAEDVATAIVNEANLQITNENLGVIDVSSSYTINNGGFVMFTNEGIIAYKFMGFVFIQWALVWPASVSDGDTIITIGDSDLFPNHHVRAPAISYQGDTVSAIRCAQNSGNIFFTGEHNVSNTGLHLTANFIYRYA